MDEENRSFGLSRLLIKIILVVVFVLFTIWLLSLSNKGLDTLTNEIFSQNIEKMKKVGKEYFKKDNLPTTNGGIEVITLEEMYEQKLIVELKDKDGKSCSKENSYVSVEKIDNEYQMKVYLECSEEKDYVLVTIKCSEVGTCESSNTKEYEYKKLSGGTWSKWSDWSKWSTNVVSKLDSRDVETKKETEVKNYTEEETTTDYKEIDKVCPTGYTLTKDKTKCYKTVTDTKNPTCDKTSNFVSQNGLKCKYIEEENIKLTCPSDYVQIGNSCQKTTSTLKVIDTVVPVCEAKEGYKDIDRNGFVCTYTKYVMDWINGKYEVVPETTTGKAICDKSGYVASGDTCNKYELHTDTIKEDLVCEVKAGYALEQIGTTCIYKQEVVKELTCPTGYTEKNNSCVKETTTYDDYNKTCPTDYKLTKDGNKCEKTETKLVNKTEEIEITYYRFRTRKYVNGTPIYKWSTSKNDQKLLNAGYTLTGKTR